MENLTLKEKIGQMLIVGMDDNVIDDRIKNLILNYKIGGIILYRKNFSTYQEMINLISELKKLNSINKIPLFIAIDQEGGRVNRMPAEIHNIKNALSLSKTNNIEIIEEAADITGEILEKSGYNMNFSPVLDILGNNTPKGIGDRCFGKNKEDVSKYGIITMKQLQNHKIISVIKHFPGEGITKMDSHYFLPSISKIDKDEVMPFAEAIKNNADAIMVGHIIIRDISLIYPASLSKKLINELRNKYKFDGLVITDDLKMRSIRLIYGTKAALKKAFLAGNDIILFRFNRKQEIDGIESVIKMAENKKIDVKRIEESVNKIISIKEKYDISDINKIEGINIDLINERIDKLNDLVNKINNE